MTCSIRLPLILPRVVETAGPAKEGNLAWLGDESFQLPPNQASIRIDVTSFDGSTRTFTGAATGRYIEILESGGLLILRARPPRDF